MRAAGPDVEQVEVHAVPSVDTTACTFSWFYDDVGIGRLRGRRLLVPVRTVTDLARIHCEQVMDPGTRDRCGHGRVTTPTVPHSRLVLFVGGSVIVLGA